MQIRTRWAILSTCAGLATYVASACAPSNGDGTGLEDGGAETPSGEASAPDGSHPGDVDAPRADVDPSPLPIVCEQGPCVQELVSFDHAFCARTRDLRVLCWGANDQEQLGRSPNDVGLVGSKPAPVPLPSDVRTIAAGPTTACAVATSGDVLCWGDNRRFQLGRETEGATHAPPGLVPGVPRAATVAVGARSACAIDETSDVWCWGTNSDGLLPGHDEPSVPPMRLSLRGRHARWVGLGLNSFLARLDDDTLWSWGHRPLPGQFGVVMSILGRYASLPIVPPGSIPSLAKAERASAGADRACAIANGRLFCWGRIGRSERVEPIAISISTRREIYVKTVAVGPGTLCATMNDGTVWCWEENPFGMLGTSAAGRSTEPLPIGGLERRAVSVALTNETACALLETGRVQCWGSNIYGSLGHGNLDSLSHPTPSPIVMP